MYEVKDLSTVPSTVRMHMQQTGQSQQAVALKMGITEPAVSLQLNPKRNWTLLTLSRFAEAVGMDVTINLVPKE